MVDEQNSFRVEGCRMGRKRTFGVSMGGLEKSPQRKRREKKRREREDRAAAARSGPVLTKRISDEPAAMHALLSAALEDPAREAVARYFDPTEKFAGATFNTIGTNAPNS